MIAGLGTTELLIILVVVLLIFGVGRISKLGSEMGRGIRAFREGVRQTASVAEKEEPHA
jgi:sec-independent protein translocase protein TatA